MYFVLPFVVSLLLLVPESIFSSEFQLQSKQVLLLRGKWIFFNNQLLTGADLEATENNTTQKLPSIIVDVPAHWNQYILPDGKNFSPYGYGTFTTVVSGFTPGQLYAIMLYFAGSSHRIYLGKSEIPLCEVGKVGQSKAEQQPEYRSVICRFYAPTERVRITIQVANFWHASGGLREAPYVGAEEKIWRKYQLQATLIYSVLAFLLGASSLFIVSFLLNKTEYRNLLVVGFALVLMVHTLNTGIRLGRELWEGYDFFVQARLNMLILPWGASFLLAYVTSAINARFMRYLGFSLVTLFLVVGLLYILLPFEQLMKLYFTNLRSALFLLLLLVAFMIYAVAKQGREVWELMVGLVVIVGSIAIALLRTLVFIGVPVVELFGFLIFMVVEATRRVISLNRAYKAQKKLLRANKIELDRMALLVPRSHLERLKYGWRRHLSPGMYYEAPATIMLLRIEPLHIHEVSDEILADLYYSLAEEIANFTMQQQGRVDRLSLGQFIVSFDDATSAMETAVFLRQQVAQWSEILQQKFIYRCGIHYGTAVWGIYGSGQRWTGGYVGDTINTAARLENLCARYKTSILMSQDAYFHASEADKYLTRMLEPVRLKGKKEHIFVYEVLDGLPEEYLSVVRSTMPAFGRGLQAFINQDFAHALLYFELVLAQNPDDTAAKLYLERTQKLLNSLPDEEWEPIAALTKKSFA